MRSTDDPKRGPKPRIADQSKAFAKDWKRLSDARAADLDRVRAVLAALMLNKGPLHPIHRDHALSGDWEGHRECHVGGDLLLIYQIDGDVVKFTRLGTHSQLFGK